MLTVARVHFDARADFDRWQKYICGRPDSHCADLAEWRLLFRELYGFTDYSYVCSDEGRIEGVMSLYRIDSPFLGAMLVSCPYFGYGGFYWETPAARDALMAEADRIARELNVDYVEFRLAQELPPPFEANTDFAEFDLDLASTPEETWQQRLSPNARQNVRKSRGADLQFRLSQDYGPCYDLLRRTLRAHGTPFHGRKFFELLAARLGSHVCYSEVWHGSRLAAGGVVIRFRDTAITPYIGSLHAFRELRANYLQYWGLIEHCTATGVSRFEMGRSLRGSTHARFKQKWGCRERPVLYNYRVINPRKRYASVSRPSRIQRMAVQAWKRLPLALTTALGPRLYRHIP